MLLIERALESLAFCDHITKAHLAGFMVWCAAPLKDRLDAWSCFHGNFCNALSAPIFLLHLADSRPDEEQLQRPHPCLINRPQLLQLILQVGRFMPFVSSIILFQVTIVTFIQEVFDKFCWKRQCIPEMFSNKSWIFAPQCSAMERFGSCCTLYSFADHKLLLQW